MIKYTLTFDINEEQLPLKEGETYDQWVGQNIFNIVADKLEAEGIEGGIGFANYAHHYCKGTSAPNVIYNNIDNTED